MHGGSESVMDQRMVPSASGQAEVTSLRRGDVSNGVMEFPIFDSRTLFLSIFLSKKNEPPSFAPDCYGS